MIARPTKTVTYTIGGFEFHDRANAEFLYEQMKRAQRLNLPIYTRAVADQPEFTVETFEEFFAERMLHHWQTVLGLKDKNYRELVGRMRELVNG